MSLQTHSARQGRANDSMRFYLRFAQEVHAHLPRYHPLALEHALDSPESRRWYTAITIEHKGARYILLRQVETRQLEHCARR